jgi:hypothetical protein
LASESGDFIGEATSLLLVAVCRFDHALSEGLETRSLILPVHTEANALVRMIDRHGDMSDPSMIRWKLFSAPMHLLQAHIWGVHQISMRDEDYWLFLLDEQLQEADREYYDHHESDIVAIKAGIVFLRNKRASALSLANEVETRLRSVRTIEARMTALLVKAWMAADLYFEEMEREGGRMYQLRSKARMILAGQTVPFCTEHRDNITPLRRAS